MPVGIGDAAGAVGLGAAGIKAIADKIRNHKLKAFQNKGEYEEFQKIKSSEEFRAYKRVIPDRSMREACLFGLRLRALQGNDGAISALKAFLRKRRGPEKLWVAEAVQIGALRHLIGILQEQDYSREEQARQIALFLGQIQRHLLLVTTDSNHRVWADRAVQLLRLNPILFCIAGSGHAEPLARRAVRDVFPSAFNHNMNVAEEPKRFTAFFRLLGPDEKRDTAQQSIDKPEKFGKPARRRK